MLAPDHTVAQETVRLSSARPVQLARPRVQVDRIPPHDHDYFEIIVGLSGSATHRANEAEGPMVAGTTAILAPRDVHALDDCTDLTVLNIYYLPEWLLMGGLENPLITRLFVDPVLRRRAVPIVSLTSSEVELVQHEADDLLRELALSSPSRTYLKACLAKIMSVIARRAELDGFDAGEPPRPEVRTLLDVVETQVARGAPFTVAPVTNRYPITGGHLARLFREETGVSPSAYYVRRRVYAAASRLLHDPESVTAIAAELGFADTAHLTRSFRAQFGVSPREYRKRYLS